MGAPLTAAVPDLHPGLVALRDGRFEEARACFARLSQTAPQSPEGPFFEAFEIWWRLIDRPEDATLRLSMEERLAEAGRRARLLQASQDPDERQRGLVFFGVSQLVDAQSKASRGSHFAAAGLVRQGHRALTAAVAARPGDSDALFAMGTYNYYADHLPALVKGLRFLLFIPGGDSARGIAQLEQAGENSELFGAESLVLLAHIFSGAYEEDYARALSYLDKAAARSAGSPLLSLARADLLYKMGRLKEAADVTAAALATVAKRPAYPRELQRALAYRAAASRQKLRDPAGAFASIDTQLQTDPPDAGPEMKRWLLLGAEAARDAGRPEMIDVWLSRLSVPEALALQVRKKLGPPAADPIAAARAEALASAAADRVDEARARLERMLDAHPGDPRLRYDIGRLLQQQGRLEEAQPYLQAVVDTARGSSTADLAGWAMMRLGWALDQQGRRAEAAAMYRRAAEMKQFDFRAAALDRAAHPAAAPPEG